MGHLTFHESSYLYICVFLLRVCFPCTHLPLVCAFSIFAKKVHELCVQCRKSSVFIFSNSRFLRIWVFFSHHSIYKLIHSITVYYYVLLIDITYHINVLQLFNVHEYVVPSFQTLLNYIPQSLPITRNPVRVFLHLPPRITLNFLCC